MVEEFETKADLQVAAADWLKARLEDALARRGNAVLMLSGGSTPGPIYERLADADLDWKTVTIGLADERWVDEDHPASNSAMVRRTLLSGQAGTSNYLPMKLAGDDPFQAVETLQTVYRPALQTDVLVLGMGPDAHTLSWFSGARGFELALDPHTPSPIAAIDAPETDVTGPNTKRMTLTLPCVANARHVLLVITGAEKRRVFETADPTAPVSLMRAASGEALTIFYCP